MKTLEERASESHDADLNRHPVDMMVDFATQTLDLFRKTLDPHDDRAYVSIKEVDETLNRIKI